MSDEINHPDHYQHPSGVECIDIAERCSYRVGNIVKYLWRSEKKHPNPVKDLQKALWYIEREMSDQSEESEPNLSQVADVLATLDGETNPRDRALELVLLATTSPTRAEFNELLAYASAYLTKAIAETTL